MRHRMLQKAAACFPGAWQNNYAATGTDRRTFPLLQALTMRAPTRTFSFPTDLAGQLQHPEHAVQHSTGQLQHSTGAIRTGAPMADQAFAG